MGYHTDFSGEFQLDKPLTPEHAAFLTDFAASRRMKRNASIAETFPDPVRIAANLPIGEDGEFYVGSAAVNCGQDDDGSVVNHNTPPASQPGLWCQWIPNEENTAIVWDEGEKFYYYVEWIKYLIEKLLQPWGYKLTGTVQWFGDEREDIGEIVIVNNAISLNDGKIIYQPNTAEAKIVPTNIMKVCDIHRNSVSKELAALVESFEPEYRDQAMKEHLYSLESIVDEIADREDDEKPSEELQGQLDELLAVLRAYEAGYIRFVND
jgi:hypothetical protein